MHIKEVILDGFKSYGKRTVCGPFDEEFNAITGLNGSGKSNILDSICFVLGISKLAQVRVSNMQGLVYKNGQAGVTKASVTIVFDNNAPGGPLGYDQHKQITVTRTVVIGGRNKYLINGHVAQQKQVQDLFHSVQLNVNNPHFLIMQGRITKVLNMNPDEILGLIEEAAGTRMYEDRKAASQRRMRKKDDKVKEIVRVLQEQITPQMEKLDGQRKHYQDWSAVNTERERLERYEAAFSYAQASEQVEAADERHARTEAQLEAQQAKLEATGAEIAAASAAVKELLAKKEDVAGDRLRELQEQESDISKLLVQENTQTKNQAKSLQADEKALAALRKQTAKSTQALEQGAGTIATAEAAVASSRGVVAAEEEALALAERNLQALSAGMQAGGDDDQSMAQKLRAAEAEQKKAATAAKVGAKKLAMLNKTLKAANKDLARETKSGDKLDSQVAAKQAEVAALQAETGGKTFDEAAAGALHDAVQQCEATVSELDEHYNTASSRLSSRLRFDYRTPSKGFDRGSVRGVVANLVTVKDRAASTALEVRVLSFCPSLSLCVCARARVHFASCVLSGCVGGSRCAHSLFSFSLSLSLSLFTLSQVAAGGKLYGVIVDTAQNAKAVLKKGQLKRRVTIIPLDKMQGRSLPRGRMEAAAGLFPGANQVRPAISLVGYADELQGAMQHVFGSTLVCENLDIAKAVTFNDRVKLRSVTLEGDSVDPSGTMSGGSRGRHAPVLSQLAAVTEIRSQLQAARARLATLRAQLQTMEGERSFLEARAEKLDLASHQLKIMQEKIANSKRGMLQARVRECEANIAACEADMSGAKEAQAATAALIKGLSKQLADLEKSREAKMGAAEAAIKTHKAKLKQASKDLRKSESECEKVKLELAQLQGDAASLEKQCTAKTAEIEARRATVEQMKQAVQARKEEYAQVANELRAQKEEMAKCEAQLKQLMKQQSKLEKRSEGVRSDIRKTEAKIARHDTELTSLRMELVGLVERNPWIESEKQFFGTRGTDYDFSGRDLGQARAQLAKLQERAAEMEKTINRKVMGMIQKAETEYQGLKRKQKMLENDRQKIEDVITKLDDQKKEALEKTWAKVTKDLGSIFSTLLPGSNAKLERVGPSVVDGLEVKVAFSNVWKASLSELSGGQRSLVALSLILSLLLFKPAPMYILDEVDAALDLSHTQNIGHMLKTHFKNSQFIVVSLKEGMFNNANVIFRTKFIDGMSTVRRTVPAGAAAKEQAELAAAAQESNAAPAAKKSKKSKSSRSRKALAAAN